MHRFAGAPLGNNCGREAALRLGTQGKVEVPFAALRWKAKRIPRRRSQCDLPNSKQ